MLEFWKDSEKEKLRRGSLIYNPESIVDDLKKAKEKDLRQEKNSKKIDPSNSDQTELEL